MATLKFRDENGEWKYAPVLKYKENGVWKNVPSLKYKDENGVWHKVVVCGRSSDDDYPTISTLTVGSSVYLNENGSPAEFYVAKHDYESDLNGTGRTLLVRKTNYSKQQWMAGGIGNDYSKSSLDAWFNNTYKQLLDADIQTAISTTTFYYTSTKSISRGVFALSITELGLSHSDAAVIGSTLPIADVLRESDTQWTRTFSTYDAYHAFHVYSSTNCISMNTVNSSGARPCFTLPAETKIYPKTNMIIG